MTNINDKDPKSIGSLVRDLTEDISTLFRSELALAKLEIKEAVANIGSASALFAAALFCGLFALIFLLLTVVFALDIVLPRWVASLIVAVLLLVIAGALALVGKNKLAKGNLAPTQTIESVKTDIQMIRSDISRSKER